MKFADWGKIPERLKGQENQLNWIEKIIISFYVTQARIKKMKLCISFDKNGKKIELEQLDQLCSHSVVIPMSAPEVYHSRESLPRKDIKPYIHTMFIGTKKSWPIAKKIMKKSKDFKVNIDKVCTWLEYLKNVHPYYKNVIIPFGKKRETLSESYNNQIAEIINTSLVATDPQTHYMERKIGSDYAAAPVYKDGTDDAFSVNPGEHDFLLVPSMAQPDAETQLLQLMYDKMNIDKKFHANDPYLVKKVASGFSCEFDNNPKIISCTFPYLFPLGLDSKKMRGSGTVKKDIVKRWMTFKKGSYLKKKVRNHRK